MNMLDVITELKTENQQLRQTIFSMQEQIDWFKRQIFGKRSEKIIANLNESQLVFDGLNIATQEPQKQQTIPEHERKISNRNGQDKITLPSDLPVERIFIDLPEEQKVCQETGTQLVKIGEEVSRKLAHKPGSFYIKEIARPKYVHPKNSDAGIKTAELPPSLLTRCQADDSLLAELLVRKYADHLPLYRISEIFSRENIQITRQLLSQWVLKSAIALKPLYDEMTRLILNSGNVFIDETPVKMLDPGAGKTKHTYMWVLSGGNERDPPYRVYKFRTNRQHHNAAEILKDFHGFVHSDKYGAYETLANKKQFTWCPCWVHIRRKFIEAEHGDVNFREMVLKKIGELFQIEEIVWTKSPEERLQMRKELETPIIDELTEAIKDRLLHGNVIPKSNFKEALGYYCSLIPYLKNYTLHPWARLDNNVSERAVRPLVIGRKNWLFVGNNDGGDAAAITLSIVQTCRAMNINPRSYLESVMSQIMDYSSQKLVELLPHNWLKNQSI